MTANYIHYTYKYSIYVLLKRWASTELTLHEEGSMFGRNIASSKSNRDAASVA